MSVEEKVRKIIAEKLEGYTGTQVDPNLEDAYVYFMEKFEGNGDKHFLLD